MFRHQSKLSMLDDSCMSNNGGVCDVTQGDRTYSGQIKGLVAELTNLTYDVLIA